MAVPDRAELVRTLYNQGLTLEEIGRRLGVSRQRAHQLVREYRVEKLPRDDRRYQAQTTGREAEIESAFLRLRDFSAVATETGVEERALRRLVRDRVPDARVLVRRPRAHRPRYSDDDLVRALRIAAAELDSPLAVAVYGRWSGGRLLDDGRPWPGPQAAMLRFGGWRRALARAGLPANPRSGPSAVFDLEDAVDAVARAWLELESPPTVAAYEDWRAGRDEFPSTATIRHHVDGWGDVQLAAWPLVHGRELPGIGAADVSEEEEQETTAEQPLGTGYRVASEDLSIPDGDPFERDPQELERSIRSHATIQNQLASMAADRGLVPLSPTAFDPNFDLAVRLPDGTVALVEVKSAKPSNLEGQLKLGLGQILRFGEALRARDERVRHVLAVELAPPSTDWSSLLDRLGVRLVTPENLDTAFDV